MFKMTMSRGQLIVLFLLLIPFAIEARPRTDTIILNNGNNISGEILEMSRGMLSVHTDSMSVVYIKWGDTARIQSEYQFVVEDTEGVRYTGILVGSTDAKVDVRGDAGNFLLDHMSVVTIFPLRRRWWRRMDGSVDLSYSYTKSSSNTQFSLGSDIRYRGSRWEILYGIDSILSIADGVTNADRTVMQLGGERYFGGRWYWLANAGFQHNSELNLDHRYYVQGGIGRRLRQTNRTLISLLGGISYSRELYTGEPENDGAEALIGSDYQFFKLYSPRVDITVQFFVLPSLTTEGRVRSELSVGSKIELISNFYWTVSLYDSYDSKPPDRNPVKNDYGVVTGISWTFNR